MNANSQRVAYTTERLGTVEAHCNLDEEGHWMDGSIATGAAHHVKLTVSDVGTTRDFYTSLLGFRVAAEFGPVTLISNGSFLIGLSTAPEPEQAIPGDRFNENRIGLDHLSFGVADRQALERAAELLGERGVTHGEINDLTPLGISVMTFRDPDNIQLELTAPIAG